MKKEMPCHQHGKQAGFPPVVRVGRRMLKRVVVVLPAGVSGIAEEPVTAENKHLKSLKCGYSVDSMSKGCKVYRQGEGIKVFIITERERRGEREKGRERQRVLLSRK